MNRIHALVVAFLSPLFFASGVWATTIYNPEPIGSSNPSAPWSYGVISGSTFNAFADYSPNNNGVSGLNIWSNDPSGNGPFPGIFDNTNSGPVTAFSTIDIPGKTLLLHPPNSADQTDLRFTAPTNLVISNISATFSAASNATPTSSDVHVFVNGTAVFNDTVNANYPNGATSYSNGPFTLLAGQTIEFRVGDGGNGYSYDGTNLVASITATPEPTSIVISAIGAVGLLARRRRKA